MTKDYSAFITEIPQNVSMNDIKNFFSKVDSLEEFLLNFLFECYEYHIDKDDKIDLSDYIEEEHLFSLSETNQAALSKRIRTKIFLKNAVKSIITPYIVGYDGNSFCYRTLSDGKIYAISAGTTYPRCFPSIECAYISALNASGLLKS